MIPKKQYSKPLVTEIALDNSISLVMMTTPGNPPPRGGGNKGSEPFQSPFGNKPFG
jgi:hypothetical protein